VLNKPNSFGVLSQMFLLLVTGFAATLSAADHGPVWTFSCRADNDLFRVMEANGFNCQRFDQPAAAVAAAAEHGPVLILAEGYPGKATAVEPELFAAAAAKKLQVYVEYPQYLPGVELGSVRRTHWERAVVASDKFGASLERLRILAIHDCHFIPTEIKDSLIVVGRVAGFDTAVYGLPPQTFPILFEVPQVQLQGQVQDQGKVLVATTKLSNFVQARYAPTDAWQAIWQQVLAQLQPALEIPELSWVPSVRPSYRAEEELPDDIERQALQRGIQWFFNSRMVLHPSMLEQYHRPGNGPGAAPAEPDLQQAWPFGHRVGWKPDLKSPPGDGSLGVLEGFDAKIFHDGTQPVRWWHRADCNGEIAGALAVAGLALNHSVYLNSSARIGDWLFFKSMMTQGNRIDPNHPAFGLIGWNDSPEYCGPGSMDGYAVYYGDDNARTMFGMMLAAAALKTDRYDQRLLSGLLGNFRISGQFGFLPDRIDEGPLTQSGWQVHFRNKNIRYSPHYQANLWACYLWAYRHTGYQPFLDRARTAIGMTIAAYPDDWIWTNGIQQERAKMLLPLAWLVRVEDSPEHRGWLKKMTEELLSGQDSSGAIGEQIGEAGKGGCPPPPSNEAYGTAETPLIQTNEDAACDLLYTTNFAFLGLHEAAAATGDPFYQEAEDQLARFLCRIQIRSENHPELDGGWFRAFEFRRWEYWASNADVGWGAWCIESGWTQSWITAVLAMRQLRTSLWDLTAESQIQRHFESLQRQMLAQEE
jgi:hypothetical protein